MEKIEEKCNPLISIIIPVYNGSNYMREAIDSALAQTYKNIEVIVVNDGSTDNTDKIAKSYGDKIIYYSKENGGVATALNLAIKKAKGKYISWLSHDDIYYPNKIEKQLKKLETIEEDKKENTILYSNYSLINEKSEITSIQEFHKIHDKDKLNYPPYPILKGLIHGCTLLIPKRCFEKSGYFNEKLKATQDYDLWFKMFPRYDVLFMPDVFVKSRNHANQNSKKTGSRLQELSELWMNMIENVSDKQKIEMSGSILNFYRSIYNYVKQSKRSSLAEKYLYDKINFLLNSKNMKDCKIVINLATYPGRKNSLKETVESVLLQADVLNVYLNDYDAIPEFLDNPRINCVLGRDAEGDLRDNGKFYFIDKVPEDAYYFTIDDDIIYPIDYVEKMLRKLEYYDDKAVVGVHGIIFHQDFSEFTKTRTSFHFMQRLDFDICVSALGTGTVAFRKALLKNLKLNFFKSTGMADLWLAAYCKDNDIKMFAIEREDKWLFADEENQEKSLWKEGLVESYAQNDIIKKHKLWGADARFLLQYCRYFENIQQREMYLHQEIEQKNQQIKERDQKIIEIENSKAFRIGNLFFRSMRDPYKFLAFPINFFRILFVKR